MRQACGYNSTLDTRPPPCQWETLGARIAPIDTRRQRAGGSRAGGNLGPCHFSSPAREAGRRLVQRPERVGCAKGPALTPSAPTSPHARINPDPQAIVAGRSHPHRRQEAARSGERGDREKQSPEITRQRWWRSPRRVKAQGLPQQGHGGYQGRSSGLHRRRPRHAGPDHEGG